MSTATTPATAANRFEALDGWRGICACLVVLFHFHGYSPLYTSGLIRNSYLFVDFFFVLSGFVIAVNYASRLDSWDGVKRFLWLRAGRVYPLHFFMLLCLVAYETAKLVKGMAEGSDNPVFSGGNDPIAVVTNLLLVQSLNIHDGLTWNGPAWSISTELWTYVIFALVSAWLGMRNWILLLVALVAPLVLLNLSKSGMDTTYDYGLIRCVFGFALGVACFRLHSRWPRASHSAGAGIMTVLEFAIVAAVVVFVSNAGTSSWSFLAPFIFAVAVLVFAFEGGLVSRLFRFRFLKWLGMLSYSIYLTHYFFVMLFPIVVKRIVHQDLWTPMPLATGQFVLAYGRNAIEGTLFYIAVLAITLGFSALTYRWVETPGREWSRRWIGSSKKLPATASAPRT
ncbi:MAG TPA: acyltransferase [Ramlibacter sp.]|nr:acyltransferase [Ramlibacter sp.]